jgi:pyruvate,water dikinase
MIIPFTSPLANLETAGGKGMNLALLQQAGFNVPPGFIIGTPAYKAFVETNRLQKVIDSTLANVDWQKTEALETASARIRTAFSNGRLPAEIRTAVCQAYLELGSPPVAVRSSATAEDLPDLSFAGQQDTFLNITGEEALSKAVVDCWSSLWTARAIGYRLRNNVLQDSAALAVIVQKMVNSAASGVLFTANPLSGLLSEMVIDATLGLGEALVSGQVEPDHYVVHQPSGESSPKWTVVSRMLGTKAVSTRSKPGGGVETVAEDAAERPALADDEIRRLVETGQRIHIIYGAPQDIEWAFAGGELFILQSRAITSLFPVPKVSFDPLLVWFSFGAIQGIIGPMTPLGRDAIFHVIFGAGKMFGVADEPSQFDVFAAAGERLWVKIGDVIRNPLGSRLFDGLVNVLEPSVGQIVKSLAAEGQIGAGSGKLKPSTLLRIAHFALPLLPRLVHNMLRPERARYHFDALIEEVLSNAVISPGADRFEQLANTTSFIRSRVADALHFLLPKFIPIFGPGMGALNFLRSISPEWALETTRSLPNNVTTEMDLALWKTAQAIHADPPSREVMQSALPGELAQRCLAQTLPPTAQAAIASFMDRYGMRGVGEIDLGQLRWREDPTPVMHVLQTYLQISPESAPDVLFAKGEQAAKYAVEKLAEIARQQRMGWLKEKLARAAARRIRLLVGARESPKFFAIRNMGIARKALLDVGHEFVAAGTLDRADDLIFLNLDELDRLAGSGQNHASQAVEIDWKALVTGRRAVYERERSRKQVPRVLVSDGRAFYDGLGVVTDTVGSLTGSPVSPGFVEGVVHIILDPRGAQLTPGEILVCPGTDPAWTPLFMAAGGLIMEVGGMMTHGSVVAREYGIPAVVGVHQATTRLRSGQRVRLDGSSGVIVILE